MKLLSSFSALVVAASYVGAATIRSAKVPNFCEEGTSELVTSSEVEGQAATQHLCKLKADFDAPKQGTKLNATTAVGADVFSSLDKRNMDLCGAPCTTYCTGGGGGPNPNDCTTLANEYAGKGTFVLHSGYALYWSYSSCQAYMTNELSPAADIVYCYDWGSWAGVVNYVAWNCQSTTGDNGGGCYFLDSNSLSWIQVQTA